MIAITPVDIEVKIRANAVRIWNEFKGLGYYKRQAFVEAVLAVDPIQDKELLNRFWNGRMVSQELNDDLDSILIYLKQQKSK